MTDIGGGYFVTERFLRGIGGRDRDCDGHLLINRALCPLKDLRLRERKGKGSSLLGRL